MFFVSFRCKTSPLLRSAAIGCRSCLLSTSSEPAILEGSSNDIRLQILDASLGYVPEHGWSRKSLSLGAQSLGLSSSSHSLVGGGGAELVHHFNFLSNNKLQLLLDTDESWKGQNKGSPIHIEMCLEKRLQMIVPYVHRWLEALALMASVENAVTDFQNALDLANIILWSSGDTQLGLPWYQKRLSLVLVFRACELSLVQDTSPEYSDTFSLLHRLVETDFISSFAIKDPSKLLNSLPSLAAGSAMTFRNIFGANQWLRKHRNF